MRQPSHLLPLLVLVGCSSRFPAPQAPRKLPDLTLAAQVSQLAPLGQTQLAAAGCQGACTFSLQVDASGARLIDAGASAVTFVAGSRGDAVDTVQVADGEGRLATADLRVGPPLQIAPSPLTIAPEGTATFLAQGGQPPYRFELAPGGNASFGAITASGQYTAGPNANQVDRVRVIDANDAGAEAEVDVGDRIVSLGLDGAIQLYAADLNGDGTRDVVAVAGRELQVLLGSPGKPLLGQAAVLPCAPTSVSAGDLDGDGRDDLLVDCGTEKLLLHGQYDGSLALAPGWPWTPAPDAGQTAIGPVIVRPSAGSRAYLAELLFDPGMLFITPASLQLEVLSDAPQGPYATDFGEAPVRAVGGAPLDISTFDPISALELSRSVMRASGSGLAVFNPTPLFHLLAMTPDFGPLADGGLAPTAVQMNPPASCGAGVGFSPPDLADVNGDGKADLYAWPLTTLEPCVQLGDGAGGFGPELALDHPVGGLVGLLPSDQLAPGAQPLFMLGDGGGERVYVADAGLGSAPLPLPAGAAEVVSGDFDGDHLSDLMVVDSANQVHLLPRDLLGDFRAGRVYHLQPQSTAGATGAAGKLADGTAVVIVDNQDGALVMEVAPSGHLSLAGHLVPRTAAGDAVIAGAGALFEADAPEGQVVFAGAPAPGGWTARNLGVSCWYLYPLRLPDGSLGAVATAQDAATALWFDDGGVQQAPVPAFADAGWLTPVDLDGPPGALQGLAVQPSEGGTVSLYAPAQDGTVAWASAPTETFTPTPASLAPTLLGIAFAPQVGGPQTTLLFRGLDDQLGAHLLGYDVATRNTFELPETFEFLERNLVQIADLDGDGRNDLLIQPDARGQTSIHAYLQEADGGFADQPLPLHGRPVLFQDNGDGLPDLLVVDAVAGTATVLVNRSTPGQVRFQ